MTLHNTATYAKRREALLRGLGTAVRARRAERSLTLREHAERAAVSERFLVQLEAGEGNISVARLADVADALGTTPAELLAAAARPHGFDGVLALVGLRGAGKTSVGGRLAQALSIPFVELDAFVAQREGMSLETLFELHGEAYFRRAERAALEALLEEKSPCVLATSGSIVTDPATYALLRGRTKTVWLKARARDHWQRVVAQGDVRPMRGRAHPENELRALLAMRTHLYAQADISVDTSGLTVDEATQAVLRAVLGPRSARPRRASGSR
jgi:XRE family aerobic/anaerobic benzoate catabolism transcriptional regulator